MAADELQTFINEQETCHVASKYKIVINTILYDCIADFGENIYVVDYDKRVRAAQESTNILHEEDDERISLGCPCNPKKRKTMNN
jgi:hypothetical protein